MSNICGNHSHQLMVRQQHNLNHGLKSSAPIIEIAKSTPYQISKQSTATNNWRQAKDTALSQATRQPGKTTIIYCKPY